MNKERGEAEVSIGGVNYLLRPTHEAMAFVEARSGKGMIQIGNQMIDMSYSSNDIVAILWGCAFTVKEKMPVKYDEFSKLCFNKGLSKLAAVAVNLVGAMLSGETEEERAIDENGERKKKESSTDTALSEKEKNRPA